MKIQRDSIQKLEEPNKPDILCEVLGEGQVAFELGEIVDDAFARQLDGAYDLRNKFKNVCQNFPRMKEIFGNAIIHIEFYDHVSDLKRKAGIEPILKFLLTLDPLFEGDVPVWKQPPLADIVKGLEVHRGLSDGPFFNLTKFIEHIDRSLELMQKKFKKRIPPLRQSNF